MNTNDLLCPISIFLYLATFLNYYSIQITDKGMIKGMKSKSGTNTKYYRIPKSMISSERIVWRARVKSAFISFNDPGRW